MIAFCGIVWKWLQKPKDPEPSLAASQASQAKACQALAAPKGEVAKAFKKFMDDNKSMDGPAMLYCSPAEAAAKLAARDAAWDAAAKKFGADQLDPASFPVLGAGSLELEAGNTTLAVVTGFVLPSGSAKSMVAGGPIGTPCGKPCRVGVIYVARSPLPDRATWIYLPCTERQTLGAANRQCNEGLLSVAELAGVCELLRRQRERMACDCQESRP